MSILKNIFLSLFLIFPLFSVALVSEEPDSCLKGITCCAQPFPRGNKIYIGPEFYHLRRTREGGTWQRGQIYGVRLGYDHIKRYRLYWGGDFSWGRGNIHGRSGGGDKLTSTFTDEQVEGRCGYTLQTKRWVRPAFTPFIGFGYIQEVNKFRSPSPLELKFRTRYYYFLTGFFSSIDLNPHLSIGFNLKVRFMQEPKCRVSDDPELKDVTLQIKEKTSYRLELPISYRLCSYSDFFHCDVVPFYEFRHYGGMENYPFDFFDTKLRFYGISVLLNLRI